MKYGKKYLVFALVLAITFIIKLNTWNDEYAEVDTFRGAALQDEVFYPLKARSINENDAVSLLVGETTYGKKDGVIMGDRMQILASTDFAQRLFGCSARLYDGKRIVLLYNNRTYAFEINGAVVLYDGGERELSVPAELHEETAYLPLKDLCEMFSCDYTYDENNYQAVISSDIVYGALPKKFDLRGAGRVGKVRNQGNDATCWAQASLTALESSLLPQEEHSFSVEHMVSENAFSLDSAMGGDYTMAMAYLLSWQGPVEKNKVKKHLQEVHFFGAEDKEAIKRAVYQYGGVSTSVYANVSTTNLSESSYYNKRKNAYCYAGEKKPNHDVVIIGWDDDYSRDNFSTQVDGDGAFICQNSWGTTFGEQGVFYVSYYDSNIGEQAVSYVKAENTANYDTIYQSDLCGWVGQIGFGKEKIHAANVFTAKADEKIASAGFYALGKETEYQLFFVSDFAGTSSLANRIEVAGGTLDAAGYYTIPFSQEFTVKKGQKFAIVLALSTPEKEHPMAIEYRSDEMTRHVDITDGEGYISNNGLDWESVEETAKGNLCMKAYGIAIQPDTD